MKRFLVAIFLVGVLGCSGSNDATSGDGAPVPAPQAVNQPGDDAAVSAIPEYNIGDVETAIRLTVRMDESSKSDSVKYLEIETRKYELASARIQLSKPYPESLFLKIAGETRGGLREGDTVVGRVRVHVDNNDEPVETRNIAFDGNIRRIAEHSFTVDVMKHVDPSAGAAVVHAEMDIFWLPGQPYNLVSPAQAIEGEEPGAIKVSNPLRIEFQ